MQRIRRFWRSLTPSERSRVRRVAQLAGAVAGGIALRRLAATAAVAATSSLVTASALRVDAQVASGARCAPIKQAWIAKAAGYRVERMPMPRPGAPVDLCRPPVGVGHTIEGSLESGLSVFRQRYAPHFTVGRDRAGRVRIIQHIPLGEIAATLQNRAGGVETNRWARVQIELAGFSKKSPWESDPGVMRALGALMLELRDVAGIPLSRPFPDQLGPGVWATTANPRRTSGRWGRVAGWLSHLEVPENEHWDMGAFRYRRAFALALAQAPLMTPGHEDPPPPRPQVAKYSIVAWKPGSAVRRLTTGAPGKTVGILTQQRYRRISIVVGRP